MYCDNSFKKNDNITYVNNAFSKPRRARKYHDKCYLEMSI